ncbi:hypothetical protein HG536_0D02730 [Torulaspora globosa]|uniref:Inactive metallocarboxypeptidase ECM14 n=1 Tax=Torulaspora globosa TaxID=48254 RepID=A0A7G3ZGW5_9SACH|nr:uncharacterized protein HG536_0D02730 [Torulaspora globosa]QLL32751.1 hypothetical protein HG536_0D02730 [Torulaspora globosa]
MLRLVQIAVSLLVVAATVAQCEVQSYAEYMVCRFKTRDHRHVVEDIVKPLTNDYDIWARNEEFIDIRLHKGVGPVEGCDIMIEDLERAVRESYAEEKGTRAESDSEVQVSFANLGSSDFFFHEFRDLETIYSWLDLLEHSFPHLVKVEWVGETFEGRSLKALHISTNNPETNPEKKTIVMTGGIHAREWISISSVCWTVYQLLTKYGMSKKETRFLDHLDFLIIPVFNPDGYAYTWEHDRLWRKNRQETFVPSCPGIDIDHSFDYQWTANNEFPCSEEYSGEEPFEAIEASSWADYLNTTKGEYKVYGFLDFHSYSQEILYPYAYSCDALPRDLENLLELSYGLSKAIRNRSGKYYKVSPACKDRGSDLMPGLGSGSALDFMYHHRARWAFQLKLRDTGNHGFLLPSKFIRPVGKETYAAVKYFCSFIVDPDL